MTVRKSLNGQYAGFATRAVAFLVDLAIIAVTIAAITGVTSLVLEFFKVSDVTTNVVAVGLSVIHLFFAFFYFVAFWVLAGQTPGKRLMGLKVIRTDGKPLTFGRALLRWVGYFISAILFLGFLWVLLDRRRQGWHDKIADTCVVYAWEAKTADLGALAKRLKGRA